MQIIIPILSLSLIILSCKGQIDETDNPITETIDSTYCDCKDLIFDEAYNHFYRFKKREGFSGLCDEFYPNGNKKLSKNLFDGKLTGKMTIWFEDGKVKEELEFDSNFQTGEHLIYNDRGDTTFYALYKRGKLKEIYID